MGDLSPRLRCALNRRLHGASGKGGSRTVGRMRQTAPAGAPVGE